MGNVVRLPGAAAGRPLLTEREIDDVAAIAAAETMRHVTPRLMTLCIVNAEKQDADDEALTALLASNGFTGVEIAMHLEAAKLGLGQVRRAS